MKKIILLLFIITLSTITVTLNAESYLGGTWKYGSSVSSVWSDYHHPSVSHYAAIKEFGGPNSCTQDNAGAGH